MRCDRFGEGCEVAVQRRTFRRTVAKVLELLTCLPAFICQFIDPEDHKSDSVRYELPAVFRAAGCDGRL